MQEIQVLDQLLFQDGKIVQGAKAKLTGAFKDNARNTSAGPAVIPGQ